MVRSYRSCPASVWTLDAGRVVVHSTASGECDVLSAADAAVLSTCREFRPLAEHARRHALATGGDLTACLARMTALADRGYLKPLDAFVTNPGGAGPHASARPSITWLAIPTRDRVEALFRCIRSYADNAAEHGHDIRVFVADGAVGGSGAAWRDLGSATGVPIVHAGHAAKVRYAWALARHGGIPIDVAEFALLGRGWPGEAIGANRNTILLATAGSLILSVDDDTLCQPHVGPVAPSGQLAFCGDADASDMWFYASRAAALAAARPASIDVFGHHALALGRSPSALAARTPADRIVFNGSCDHMLAGMLSKRGRIVATLTGVTGDSGLHSGDWIALYGSLETRRRSLECGQDYLQAARTCRDVIRQSPQMSVCHGGHFMSLSVGLDNRVMLPPFLPVCRSEDRLFSAMIGWCSDEMFYAHLPWTVLHLPEGIRSNATHTWTTSRLSDIVLAILDALSAVARPDSPEARLRWLGSEFEFWGTAPHLAFREFVTSSLKAAVAAMIERHEAMLRVADDASGRWAPVRAQLRGALAALGDPDFYVPVEWRGRWTGDEAVRQLQRLIAELGRLMQWWPDIRRSASALAARGCHVGERVV